jgi:hypothetical protein
VNIHKSMQVGRTTSKKEEENEGLVSIHGHM